MGDRMNKKCLCDFCEPGMTKQEIARRRDEITDEAIREHGFSVHAVVDYDDGYYNVHTHGFDVTWGHVDMQIVFPIDPKISHSLLWNFARKIKAGEKFKDGDMVDGIVTGFKVKLMGAVEDDRHVLRILLPDKNGKFPGDPGCKEGYEKQDKVRLLGDYPSPKFN